MKIIIVLFLSLNLALAQQATQSPNAIKSKGNNKLVFQTSMMKWREKLKQFNTPELRKSRKYAELSQEMRKELRDIRNGKPTESAPMVQKQIEKNAEVTNVIQPFGMQTKHITQVDTPQQHKPSLSVVPAKDTVATTCYDVPFASKSNTIELLVANSSTLTAEKIKVEATNVPAWLKFDVKDITLPELKSKEEQTVLFTFSVDKSAQVNKEQTLSFSITDKTGQKWTKEIKLKVAPPATYELFQNYPNPFNPTTVISYQLSAISNVSLKIYDIIGREVVNLVNEQQEPGGHQVTLNAQKFSSGVYIYRLIARDEQNNQHVFQKKMVILK
jgi:hypothetical protein